MVAAAPKQGALRPVVAVSLLVAVVVLLGTICFLSRYTALYRIMPLNKSPEVLRDRAAELAGKFGYTGAVDSAYGMGLDRDYLDYIHENDQSTARWSRLSSGQPAAIYFWYRQSPRPFSMSADGNVSEEFWCRYDNA